MSPKLLTKTSDSFSRPAIQGTEQLLKSSRLGQTNKNRVSKEDQSHSRQADGSGIIWLTFWVTVECRRLKPYDTRLILNDLFSVVRHIKINI